MNVDDLLTWFHSEKTDIEKAVNISAEDQATGLVVSTEVCIGVEVCSLQRLYRLFSGEGANAAKPLKQCTSKSTLALTNANGGC